MFYMYNNEGLMGYVNNISVFCVIVVGAIDITMSVSGGRFPRLLTLQSVTLQDYIDMLIE